MPELHYEIVRFIEEHPNCTNADLLDRFKLHAQTLRKYINSLPEIKIRTGERNKYFYRVVGQRRKSNPQEEAGIRARMKDSVIFYRKEGWTSAGMSRSLGCSEITIRGHIQSMCEQNIIERLGETFVNSKRYVIYRGVDSNRLNWMSVPFRISSNQELGIWPAWRQW